MEVASGSNGVSTRVGVSDRVATVTVAVGNSKKDTPED